MNKKQIENLSKELVLPIVEAKGFELVDVEYVKEYNQMYLRIYIDKEDGITIDDCQEVSIAFNDEIEKVDPIEENYFLEVSSPGIDRPFKTDSDFEKNIGEEVEVNLYKAKNGRKRFSGEMKSFDSEVVVISEEDGVEVEFIRSEISKINRAVKF